MAQKIDFASLKEEKDRPVVAKTFPSGYGTNFNVVRSGNTVIVSGQTVLTSELPEGHWNKLIETIPIGFRPVVEVTCTGDQTQNAYPIFWKLEPNGDMYINSYGVPSGWSVHLTGSWFTNDPFPAS